MSSRMLTSIARAASRKTSAPLVTESKKFKSGLVAKNLFTLNSVEKPFTLSAVTLAALVPLAIIDPNVTGAIVDPVIAVAIPFHMYHGVKYVIHDYVPVSLKAGATLFWLVLCVLSGYGLYKLSIKHGLIATIKSLWYPAGSYVKK